MHFFLNNIAVSSIRISRTQTRCKYGRFGLLSSRDTNTSLYVVPVRSSAASLLHTVCLSDYANAYATKTHVNG